MFEIDAGGDVTVCQNHSSKRFQLKNSGKGMETTFVPYVWMNLRKERRCESFHAITVSTTLSYVIFGINTGGVI